MTAFRTNPSTQLGASFSLELPSATRIRGMSRLHAILLDVGLICSPKLPIG